MATAAARHHLVIHEKLARLQICTMLDTVLKASAWEPQPQQNLPCSLLAGSCWDVLLNHQGCPL